MDHLSVRWKVVKMHFHNATEAGTVPCRRNVYEANCNSCCADLPATGKTAVAAGGAKQLPAAAAVASGGMSDADADLEARLENLRRQ